MIQLDTFSHLCYDHLSYYSTIRYIHFEEHFILTGTSANRTYVGGMNGYGISPRQACSTNPETTAYQANRHQLAKICFSACARDLDSYIPLLSHVRRPDRIPQIQDPFRPYRVGMGWLCKLHQIFQLISIRPNRRQHAVPFYGWPCHFIPHFHFLCSDAQHRPHAKIERPR